MTGEARFCPQCGTRRTGFFRFCAECRFDFDELLILGKPAAADRPPMAPTQSDVARPIPFVLGDVPAANGAVAVAPPPVAVASPPAAAASPPPTAAPSAPPSAGKPRRMPVVLQTGAAKILARRPDLTLTRIAIVVLAALLVFSAISNLLRSSAANSSQTPLPTTGLASPLVVESPGVVVLPPTGPSGPTQIGIVTSIVDGDTIHVDIDGERARVRYIGIDSPEPDATDPAIKHLADAATAANGRLVQGLGVYLERDVSEEDQFGRLLRNVWLLDSEGAYTLVNLELVRLGFAQVSTFPPDVKYENELTAAQQAAMADGVGLWGSWVSSPPAPAP